MRATPHVADSGSTGVLRARLAIAVICVGLAAAAGSVLFRKLLHLVYRGLLGTTDVLSGVAALPPWACVLLPAAGAAVAALVVGCVRSGNSGVGGVMEAATLGQGSISFRASLARVVASFAAVASGGSIGREGPLIQLGAGIGEAFGRWFRSDAAQRQVIIAAGAAAGFAAAYGTPLAALLFVGEVVTISSAMRLVLPASVAAVSASIVAGFGPLYGARAFGLHATVELVAFAGLGVAAGLLGVGFMRLLDLIERLFSRIPGPVALRAALGGVIAGAIAIGVPAVAGNGYEAIHGLLDRSSLFGAVALLLVAKAIATAASVGSGVPGGVFTPSLLLGASLGHLVALLLAACGADVDPGAYAVAGMAATCAATTHAPAMACVMLLELTQDSALIVPLLLCSTIATITSRFIHRESLYTEELRRRGVTWPASDTSSTRPQWF